MNCHQPGYSDDSAAELVINSMKYSQKSKTLRLSYNLEECITGIQGLGLIVI